MARVLAYESLMWDNALATCSGQTVHVDGFQRAFVGSNTTRWGSPDHPCPQIGLVPGEGCDAVLFELPRRRSRHILHNLKQREGGKLRTLRFGPGNGRQIKARSFLPPPEARVWTDQEGILRALLDARGKVGTGAEYVRTIVHAMDLWKIDDPLVREVWERLQV